jgi:hypothetical protein
MVEATVKVTDGHRIFAKGAGLMLVSFLAPIHAVFDATAKFDYWPSWVRIVTAIIAGLLSASSTLVAFCDTGFGKWMDKQQTGGQPPQKPEGK